MDVEQRFGFDRAAAFSPPERDIPHPISNYARVLLRCTGSPTRQCERRAPVLPHAIMQLETGIFCDVELTVGRIPRASRLVVQGEQIVAEGGDYWRQGRGLDESKYPDRERGRGNVAPFFERESEIKFLH